MKLSKLDRFIEWRKLNKRIIRDFGLKAGIYDTWYNVIFRKKGALREKSEKLFYESIKKVLKTKLYNKNIETYRNGNTDVPALTENLPIWIFWWQGIEQAPELVKVCYKSVIAYSDGHPVIVIDEKNYRNYADIPQHIIDRLRCGEMTITHFSDILRCQLLYQQGGMWLDATVFVSAGLGIYFKRGFYTINHGKRCKYHVCKGKWTGFCMMSLPGTRFYEYMTKMFYDYWATYDYLVCYLLIDCFIALDYENNSDTRLMIDSVASENTGVFEMASLLNNEYDEEIMKKILEHSSLHKLSYRKNLQKYTNGHATIFQHLTDLY